MGKLEWSFCHDDDWITYGLAYVLLYPYIVWGGFFIAGIIFSSPILRYVSWCSSIFTWLVAYGLQKLLTIKRPSHQDCEQTLAVPDLRFVIGVVNILTVSGIVIATRKGIHPSSILFFVGGTILYFIAVNVNNYLTPIQFILNLGFSLVASSFWVSTYTLFVRPILLPRGWLDVSMLGVERAHMITKRKIALTNP